MAFQITKEGLEAFQKYITLHKIRIHGPVFEEFYKLTKGYYFYATLALKVMTLNGLTPIEFMDIQSKSFLSLKEFLFKENIPIKELPILIVVKSLPKTVEIGSTHIKNFSYRNTI